MPGYMIALIFLLLFIEVVGALSYFRALRKMVDYAHANDLQMNGVSYRNIYQLSIDLSFLNYLFNGDLSEIEDVTLHAMVIKARRLLKFVLVASCGPMVIMIANGIAMAH